MRRPHRSFLAAVLLAGVAVAAGCAAPDPETTPSRTSELPSVRPASERRSVLVVGDSNSTGFSGTLESGVRTGAAWVSALPTSEFEWIGGWAVDGATTAAMLRAVSGLPPADIVVIMGGTNDVGSGADVAESATNVVEIGRRAPAARVVVAGVAPYDPAPTRMLAFNDELRRSAEREGWTFVDAWATLRAEDGRWLEAFRTDGVHTTPEGYAQAGAAIANALG